MINKLKFIKIISFILILGLFAASVFLAHYHSLTLINWINELGWWAPVLFLFLYILASFLFLPTMILTLAGGALFGPVHGTAINLLGATLGAAISFLISRYFIYNWFVHNRGEKLNKLIEGANKKGWVFVAFLRLIPVIPSNIVNYGLGITDISFRSYIMTTFLFLIPAEIIYTYFGYASMEAISNSDNLYRTGSLILLGLSLVFIGVMHLVKKIKI